MCVCRCVCVCVCRYVCVCENVKNNPGKFVKNEEKTVLQSGRKGLIRIFCCLLQNPSAHMDGHTTTTNATRGSTHMCRSFNPLYISGIVQIIKIHNLTLNRLLIVELGKKMVYLAHAIVSVRD